MDVEHARTFIAVMETRSFVHAAEQLYVTQSTVSARVKALEERLGCRLFNRSKAGVSLTSEGVQFSRHAMTFVRIWAQAQQEVGLPPHITTRISIGAQISHWDDIMVNWMCWLRQEHPDLAVRAEIASNDQLMRQLVDGVLDLAVLYTPQAGSGLRVEKLFDEEIVLVSTKRPDRRSDSIDTGWQDHYVFVDWGPEYRTEHALAWPDLATPAVHFNVGAIALEFILRNGGAGYFPVRMVRKYMKENTIFRIRPAPSFQRPTYLVMTPDRLDAPVEKILNGLRWIAVSAQVDDSLPNEDGIRMPV